MAQRVRWASLSAIIFKHHLVMFKSFENHSFWCCFHRYSHHGLTMPQPTLRQPVTTSKTSTSGWQEVTSTLRTWNVNRTTSSGRTNSKEWSQGAEGEIGLAEFDLHGLGLEKMIEIITMLWISFNSPCLSQNALCLEAPPLCFCSDSHSSAHRHNAL